jgi:7,8-dihydropterin-6-yl-methyl-4-(beta-D-ribofuranosyl)aminobenzene 5'-phosphate synthase
LEKKEGVKIMMQAIIWVLVVLAVFLVYLEFRFRRGKRRAEDEWQKTEVEKIKDFGSTRSLEVLPLVDWYTSREDLKGECGVSYLIKTDENSILFDVGLNSDNSDPSPLLHNMKQLGISKNDFDIIVISHNHQDHVGGIKWQMRKSFSLTTHQIDLGSKKVYTPVPMTYPGLAPIWTKDPTVIAKGVAVIGVIPSQLFFMGWTLEQSLAVNVEGKGVVLIVGCGHQTLPKIIDRTRALFDEPLYGIIGGLHYPVTSGRGKIPIHQYVGTGKRPWTPITIKEVRENINYLKKVNPEVVGLSGHDSCDASIEEFRKAFPDAYKDVRVGEKIIIS